MNYFFHSLHRGFAYLCGVVGVALIALPTAFAEEAPFWKTKLLERNNRFVTSYIQYWTNSDDNHRLYDLLDGRLEEAVWRHTESSKKARRTSLDSELKALKERERLVGQVDICGHGLEASLGMAEAYKVLSLEHIKKGRTTSPLGREYLNESTIVYLKEAERILGGIAQQCSMGERTAYVWLSLGEIHLLLQEYDQAAVYVRDFITEYPYLDDSEKAWFFAGEIYFSKQDFSKAARAYEQVLRYEGPISALALYRIGLLHGFMKKQMTAIQYFSKAYNLIAITKNPNSSTTHIGSLDIKRGVLNAICDVLIRKVIDGGHSAKERLDLWTLFLREIQSVDLREAVELTVLFRILDRHRGDQLKTYFTLPQIGKSASIGSLRQFVENLFLSKPSSDFHRRKATDNSHHFIKLLCDGRGDDVILRGVRCRRAWRIGFRSYLRYLHGLGEYQGRDDFRDSLERVLIQTYREVPKSWNLLPWLVTESQLLARGFEVRDIPQPLKGAFRHVDLSEYFYELTHWLGWVNLERGRRLLMASEGLGHSETIHLNMFWGRPTEEIGAESLVNFFRASGNQWSPGQAMALFSTYSLEFARLGAKSLVSEWRKGVQDESWYAAEGHAWVGLTLDTLCAEKPSQKITLEAFLKGSASISNGALEPVMIGFGALLERSGGPLWAHKWWSSIEERLSSSAKENIVVKIGMNIVLATEALKRGDWERAEESLVHIITSEFKAVEAVPVGVFDRARLKLAQTKERQGQYVEGAQAWFKVAGQNTLSNDRLLGLKRGLEITVHQRDPLLLKKSTELKPIWKALNLQATDSQDPCVWVGDLVSQWANVSNGGRADLEQMTLLSQHGHACYRNVLSSPAVLVERTKACQVTANWRELIEHGRIYDVNYKVLLEDFGKFSRKLLSTASKGNVVACEVLSGWQSLDEGRLLLRKFESHTLKLRASKKINVAAKRFSAIVQKLSKLFTKAVAKLVELENHSSGIVRYLALSDIGRLYATMGIRIDHLTNRASSALEKEGQSIFHEMVQAQMAELRNQKAVYMRAASSLLEQLGPREKWLRFVTIPPLGRSASDG